MNRCPNLYTDPEDYRISVSWFKAIFLYIIFSVFLIAQFIMWIIAWTIAIISGAYNKWILRNKSQGE